MNFILEILSDHIMSKLKKINKQNIIDSVLWKPPDKPISISRDTNSWFNMDQMNYDDTNHKIRFASTTVICSKPIRIYPTIDQRSTLLIWNEIYRQVYNLTVVYLKTNKVISFPKMRKIIDMEIARNRELTKKYIQSSMLKHTRDNAINDCLKAYKTAFANIGGKNIKFFKIRYKKQSHHLSSIVLDAEAFSKKKNGFAIRSLGEMESSVPLTGIEKACRLCYNSRTGKFIIRVPYDKQTRKFVKCGQTCSLDPGMRTFQTVYSQQENCYEICSNKTNKQIYNLINRIENAKTENPRYKKYQNRLREKLRNKIKDMHYKVCNFLCRSFDTILVGNMSTKSIISNDLNLHKTTKKYCLALSHFLFKQRLIAKAREFGNKVEIVDESYTSKTCGGCGELNESLGSDKVFECGYCSYRIDRDINGARNILIKYLC